MLKYLISVFLTALSIPAFTQDKMTKIDCNYTIELVEKQLPETIIDFNDGSINYSGNLAHGLAFLWKINQDQVEVNLNPSKYLNLFVGNNTKENCYSHIVKALQDSLAFSYYDKSVKKKYYSAIVVNFDKIKIFNIDKDTTKSEQITVPNDSTVLYEFLMNPEKAESFFSQAGENSYGSTSYNSIKNEWELHNMPLIKFFDEVTRIHHFSIKYLEVDSERYTFSIPINVIKDFNKLKVFSEKNLGIRFIKNKEKTKIRFVKFSQ